MSARRLLVYVSLAFLLLVLVGVPIKSQFFTQSGASALIAGRNVNMVAGTKLPGGDPYVQRQNEPSIAVSTRNPMHLFAAANDYRTIDMSEPYKVPGIEGTAAGRDAWIGVFKSFNAGQSWITELLSGFPQDISSNSPIHGFDTACDPIVRAGAYGRFYLSGIAFNRSQNQGAVFISSYQDDNNLEGGDCIHYLGTKIVDAGNSGQFIDMPNMAVDIPRSVGQPGNVYLAFTVFLGNTDINVRSKVVFVRSTDGGLTWSGPIKLTESQHIIQRPVIAIDPNDGNKIYVVFRRFAMTTMPGGIVIVKSIDGGKTFTKPADIATVNYPFDQKTTNNSFRTNSYPTMAIDAGGNVYVAWSERQGGDSGQARIVLSTSSNQGLTWSLPMPVELTDESNKTLLGHQFMPSLAYAGGKLILLWYDQRGDIALNSSKFIMDSPGVIPRHTIDVRAAEAVPGASPAFSSSIQVSRYLFVLDLDANGNPQEENGHFKVKQQEFNPPNLPLFQQGTVPFHGDYLEIAASPQFLPPTAGYSSWVYNTYTSEPTIFHAAWTDNRDVWPPGGSTWGNWTLYTPPYSDQDPDWVPPTCTDGSYSGLRNQNVYSANLSRGVIVGSPGNTKQLSITGSQSFDRRTFVVYLKNTTDAAKTLDLNIPTSSPLAGFDKELTDQAIKVSVAPYSSASVTVFVALSSGLAPVRVDVSEVSVGPVGYVILNPDPTTPNTSLTGETHNPRVDNPRVWNYDLGNKNEPNARIINPRVDNPRVDNPRVDNPRVDNPRVDNPRVDNPRVDNPRVDNPRVDNQSIVNHEVANPRVDNPRVDNTALTDVTWPVTNAGNTTSAYTLNLLATAAQYQYFNTDPTPNASDPRLIAQVLVYKVFYNPAARACDLKEEHSDELIVNIPNPRVDNAAPTSRGFQPMATVAGASDVGLQNVTFYLEPQETAYITLRVYDPIASDNIAFVPDNVTTEVVAEAPNTGETDEQSDQPPRTDGGFPWTPSPEIIATPPLLTFTAVQGGGNPGPQSLTIAASAGYTLNYTLDTYANSNWLSVSPIPPTPPYPGGTTHNVSVNITGLAAGTYQGTITIYDTAEGLAVSNNPLKIPVTLTINPSGPPPSTEWLARYNSSANLSDEVSASVVDSAGNVYVTGFTETAYGYEYLTIKFDAAGNRLWAQRYGPSPGYSSASDLAVDSAGNVYVTGASASGFSPDYVTVMYGANGSQQWVATYDGPANGSDVAKAIAVGPDGSVYVTGNSAGVGTNLDFATVKYSALGVQQWVARHDGGSNGDDTAADIALDSAGNVFVTGTSWAMSTGQNIYTVKYANATGQELTYSAYDDPASGSDFGVALAVGPSGNVYVTGKAPIPQQLSPSDFVTIKYNNLLQQQWAQTYDGTGQGNDEPTALTIDQAENVYVTGKSDTDPTAAENFDYATIKYNAAGAQQWVRLYNGPGNGADTALDVAVDSSGNVLVTGESSGVGSGLDYATIGYDSSGTERWVRRYNGTGNAIDTSRGVGVDSWGNVYIAGSSWTPSNEHDVVAIKYLPTLQEWVVNSDGPDHLNDVGNAIALDSSGNAWVTGKLTYSATGGQVTSYRIFSNGGAGGVWMYFNGGAGADDAGKSIAVHSASGDVYVAGTITQGSENYFIQKIDPNNPSNGWVQFYDGPSNGTDDLNAMTIDAAGNVYVTGKSYGAADYDFATLKYSSTGSLLWTARYNGSGNDDQAFAIAVDSSGNVYVTGWTDTDPTAGFNFDYLTIKYDSLGNPLWVRTYNVGLYDEPLAITLDSSGNVYVTGGAGNAAGAVDCVTLKYDSNGNLLKVMTYSGAAGSDFGDAIAIDASDNIYVTGVTSSGADSTSNYLTIKYDQNGNQLWVRTYDGPGRALDIAYRLALDSSGNVVVTGMSVGVPTYNNSDYATVKYDANGNELWVMRYNGPGGNAIFVDQARALAIDSTGNVFVTGQSYRVGYGYDYTTVKYRKEGT